MKRDARLCLRRALMPALLGCIIACQTATPGTPQPTTGGTASPTPPISPAGPPTDSPPPPTATAPPTTPQPAGDGWRYLADFPAGDALEVSSVSGWQDGFVAVGFEPLAGEGFGGRRNGVVWTSADGLSWQRVEPAEFEYVTPLRVVEHDGQLFVLGSLSSCAEFAEDDDCEDLPGAGINAWRSTDAASWQRLTLPDDLRLAILDGVEVGPQGLLAYGSTGEEFAARLWLSSDGDEWAELTDLAGVDPVSALAAGPAATVIFGTRYLPEEDEVETVAAVGGESGFVPAALPAGQRGSVLDAAWAEAGFVAVGLDDRLAADGYLPLLLYSADGGQWHAPDIALPDGAGLHAALSLAGGYLAFGSLPAEAGAGRERLLATRSYDGLAWHAPTILEGGLFRQFSSAAAGTAGVVAFATDFDATDEEDPLGVEGSRIQAWFLAREVAP